MKKYIFTTVFLLLTHIQSAFGQAFAAHEIQVGFGPAAREHILDDAVVNFFKFIFDRQQLDVEYSKSFNVTYRYQPRRRVAIGFTSGFNTGTTFKSYLFSGKTHYKHRSVLMAFEMKITYLERPTVAIYGMWGAGGAIISEREAAKPYVDPEVYGWPTAQITPFGIRWGEELGVFAELGYGYKGLANFGLSARF